MTIYLNAVTGSRELEGCAIDKAITALAMRLAQLRNGQPKEADTTIDLTMILPGKNNSPDFEGMRLTGFSSEEGTLYMESVIPESMLDSELAERYVSAVVEDAMDNAAEFFSKQGLRFNAQPWQSALQTN